MSIRHPSGKVSFFMARPSSYTPEVINKIDEYLKTVGREQTKLPTRYGFAKFIGVDSDTLLNWEKKNVQFLGAIKKVDEEQKLQLMEDGLYGGKEVNASMAIFLLKANHGLIETDRHEFKGDGFLIKLDAGNIIQPTSKVSSETA